MGLKSCHEDVYVFVLARLHLWVCREYFSRILGGDLMCRLHLPFLIEFLSRISEGPDFVPALQQVSVGSTLLAQLTALRLTSDSL